MATHNNGRSILRDNLVFEFDRDNPKQYFGKPTTNFSYNQNRYKNEALTKGLPPGSYTNASTATSVNTALGMPANSGTSVANGYAILEAGGKYVLGYSPNSGSGLKYTVCALGGDYNLGLSMTNATSSFGIPQFWASTYGYHTLVFRWEVFSDNSMSLITRANNKGPCEVVVANRTVSPVVSEWTNPVTLSLTNIGVLAKKVKDKIGTDIPNIPTSIVNLQNYDFAGFSADGKQFYIYNPGVLNVTSSKCPIKMTWDLPTPWRFTGNVLRSLEYCGVQSGTPLVNGLIVADNLAIKTYTTTTDLQLTHAYFRNMGQLTPKDNALVMTNEYFTSTLYSTNTNSRFSYTKANDGNGYYINIGSSGIAQAWKITGGVKLSSTAEAFENNHPDCVIGTYVNSGVNSGNWSVTHHAYWKYDEELNQPVVIMNDNDGQWKAKSWGTGYSFNSMGLVAGQTYSISWLQWTTDTAKAANVGLYMRNSAGTWGFHAGLSQSQSTAWNTKPYTWQRCYATFTVPANMNMSNANNIYMYGHYNMRGVVKIADVQFENDVASVFTGYNRDGSTISSRSVFHMDPISGNTTTPYNLVWQGDGSFTFNGSSSYATSAAPITGNSDSTAIVWCKPHTSGMPTNTSYTGLAVWGSRSTTTPSGTRALSLNTSGSTWYVSSAFWGNDYVPNNANVSVVKDDWNMVGMVARGIATTNNVTLFSGNANGFNTVTGSSSNASRTLNTSSGSLTIGCLDLPGRYFSGEIAMVQIYNKELTAAEYEHIFNTTKSRFGL